MLELIWFLHPSPEKDHPAQLRALASLFSAHPEHRANVKLVLLGSARDAEDEARVDALKTMAVELKIQASLFIQPIPCKTSSSFL